MTIALVSAAHILASGLNTFTSGAINTTGCDFLVVAVIDYAVSPAAVLTDSKGNTWLGLTAYTAGGAVGRVKLYYAVNPTVGSGHTFTLTGTTIAATVIVQGFSGVALTSPFDTGKDSGSSATATSIQPGSLTPSENNTLVVTGMAYQDTTVLTVNSGFTITDQITYTGGDHFGGGLAHLIQTIAAAVNPTWSWTNSVAASAAMAVFKAAAAAGGVRAAQRMLMGMGA